MTVCGHTSWGSRRWASSWAPPPPPVLWEKLISLRELSPIPHPAGITRRCVWLTGVFMWPPTACFLLRNAFSISSRRPAFSSWMDTKASISLEKQTELCWWKSQNKSSVNQHQSGLVLDWGGGGGGGGGGGVSAPLLGCSGSSCRASRTWRVGFFLLFVAIFSSFRVEFYRFNRLRRTLRINRRYEQIIKDFWTSSDDKIWKRPKIQGFNAKTIN